MRPWLLLGASSLFQVGWLVSLRETSGFRRPVPLVCYAVFGLASTFLLSRSLEKIPLATAYAVWTGLSVAGSLLFEMASGRQAGGSLRIACILLILAAATGLQLAGATTTRH
jgi:quaternary ammonium compound-resistance protein SugE